MIRWDISLNVCLNTNKKTRTNVKENFIRPVCIKNIGKKQHETPLMNIIRRRDKNLMEGEVIV